MKESQLISANVMMTSRNRNQDISPAGSDNRPTAKRSVAPSIGKPPIPNQEMPARTEAIRTADIWNVGSTMVNPRPLSCREEDATDMTVTDKDEELLIETEDVRIMHVEMQRMVESTLHVFQETTLERRIEGTIKTIFVSFYTESSLEATSARLYT